MNKDELLRALHTAGQDSAADYDDSHEGWLGWHVDNGRNLTVWFRDESGDYTSATYALCEVRP